LRLTFAAQKRPMVPVTIPTSKERLAYSKIPVEADKPILA
jgi:hypothetical protein